MKRWRPLQGAGSARWSVTVAWCGLLLTACEPGAAASPSVQPVLSSECRIIDSSRAAIVHVTSPAQGMLRVEVQEHGISTVSFLNDGTPSATATASASPVERLGTVVLTANVRRGQRTAVEVHAHDIRDIRGEICISAELVAAANITRQQAEREFSAAGLATHAKNWDAAFGHYLSAARRFDQLHLPRAAATARSAMAQLAYWRFDRKRDAYALASMALTDYGPAADPLLLGALAGLEAEALLDLPEVDPKTVAAAVHRWLETERRYESTNRYGARELARVEVLMGYLQYVLNEIEPARATFVGAAQRCRDLGDWDCYAVASQNLAWFAEQGKDYAVALTTYADALRRLPAELNPKLQADIWNNMGTLQGTVGLFSASERSHTAAMRAYAQLGDCQGVRRSFLKSGYLLVHVGNLADAENDLARAASSECPALLAAAAAPEHQLAIRPTAEADGMQRDSRESGHSDFSRPCAKPLDPTTLTQDTKTIVFNSLLALGNEATSAGDAAEVWRCLEAAQHYDTSDTRDQLRLANARGNAFLERNDPGSARAEFTRALNISDTAGLSTTSEDRRATQLGLVKSMLAARRPADGLQAAEAALAVNTASGDIEKTITSLRLIAAGYRDSGQQAAAVRVLQVAADLVEAVPIDELDGEQRATFLASQHTVFAELTDIYARQGASDTGTAWRAFEASERGRARSLRFALTQQTRDASSPVGAPAAAGYQRLLGEVAAVTKRTASQSSSVLIDEIDELALRERGSAETFDRAQLGRTLEQLDATLVEYASGAAEMLAFVIGKNGARVIHLGDSREIERAAAELRDRLRDSETPANEVSAAAQTLARLVWWPVAPYLPQGRVVVVPDDALHTVPLAVLPWSADSGQQLVLQHAETTVIPSALFLMRVHPAAAAHSSAPRMALIGDPIFRVADWRRECTHSNTGVTTAAVPATPVDRSLSGWTDSLPRLPGTRAEVNAIARLAQESRPGSQIASLLGCSAVPSALREVANADVDLLHIATHARIDAQRPRLSALALTPESPQDMPASTFGLLDILGLKLNSRLVVLSACDTSRGRLLPGEGVLGPAQAFLQAGSAAVLASYWRVDDQITSTFMQRFYRYLLVERLSASAALRKTQLDSAATGMSYEWAAFALYGWPDSSI